MPFFLLLSILLAVPDNGSAVDGDPAHDGAVYVSANHTQPGAEEGTVFGWVRAEGSLEPIAFASVEAGGRTAMTDQHGYYVLRRVAAGPVTVRASMLGYGTAERRATVTDGDPVRVDLVLEPAPIQLEEIRVGGTGGEMEAATASGPPPVRMDASTMEFVPALAEKDAFRAIQMLPSVAAASDFSSALYIRGGSPDQSVVLVDGAPIFNPYHLAGIFSAIDPDAIATLEVHPGGMPAPEPDRASGVVKVWTRDGGRDRVRGHGAVGLVSSRLGIDGPLPIDGGTYLISGRRTYLDVMTKAAYELGFIRTPFPYAFTDIHAKITQDIGRTGRLNVSGYLNDERVHTPREVEPDSRTSFSWGTLAGSARYRQPIGATLLAEITLAATSFDGDFLNANTHESVTDTSFLGTITMRGLTSDASLAWHGGRHVVRAGIQLEDYDFRYRIRLEDFGGSPGDGDDIEDLFSTLRQAAGTATIAGYIQDEWSLSDAFSARLGVRALHAPGVDTEIMPRLGLRWSITPDIALTAAAGRYAQAIHSLRDEESILASIMPYELLVPASDRTGFLVAEDVIAGIHLSGPSTNVRIEGYYKRYPSLPTPPLTSDPLTAPIFAPEFLPGSGSATGLEAFVQQRWGQTTVMGSYAMSGARREVAEESYTARYNRRHLLDVTAAQEWGSGGLLTARFAAGTGQPYTPAIGRLDPYFVDTDAGITHALPPRLVLGEHNSERLPGYLRLDVGVRKEFERRWFGRDVTLEPYLQVLNALGTRNVTGGSPQYSFDGEGMVEYLPALPTLPTFGMEWSF